MVIFGLLCSACLLAVVAYAVFAIPLTH